ncbi:hypothetical protein [Asanoa sp. NPDC050611]|uniref:hypothetical protein n=1 Tax=Asanoa sp. NPDC050611 TaxID=3157098 RepID=UPI0033D5B19A
MGLIRKTLSVSTLGIIKFRSNRESNARSNRKLAKAAELEARAAMLDAETRAKQARQND